MSFGTDSSRVAYIYEELNDSLKDLARNTAGLADVSRYELAARAMQAIVTSDVRNDGGNASHRSLTPQLIHEIARVTYEIADAMLEARQR